MREIKFRGYSKLNNMWYYGLLGKFDNKYYIECEGGAKPFVEEESISQYTGFKDRAGKEIYEGDIIKNYDDGISGAVIFDAGEWLFWSGCSLYESQAFKNKLEVIGNTYEEKLKDGK